MSPRPTVLLVEKDDQPADDGARTVTKEISGAIECWLEAPATGGEHPVQRAARTRDSGHSGVRPRQ